MDRMNLRSINSINSTNDNTIHYIFNNLYIYTCHYNKYITYTFFTCLTYRGEVFVLFTPHLFCCYLMHLFFGMHLLILLMHIDGPFVSILSCFACMYLVWSPIILCTFHHFYRHVYNEWQTCIHEHAFVTVF